MPVIKDNWMHWEEALKRLGPTWKRIDNKLVLFNEHNCVIRTVRIYDGSEHEKAEKDCVITNIGKTSLSEIFIKKNDTI